MGLTAKFKKWAAAIKAEANAPADLKAALKNNDIEAAKLAISNARPQSDPQEDRIISVIRDYSQQEDRDEQMLSAIRQAVYENFDPKIQPRFDIFEYDPDPKATQEKNLQQYGFANPYHAYAMAAYMDDTAMMDKLNTAGIHPDKACEEAMHESFVLGMARIGNYEAMKTLIRHDATLDKTQGLDEFPAIHAFRKPLFLILHKGVADALMETGNERIINEVKKGLAQIRPAPKNKGPRNRQPRLAA